jgi:hypothetical protein
MDDGPIAWRPEAKDPPGIQRLLDSGNGHVTIPCDASAKWANGCLFFLLSAALVQVWLLLFWLVRLLRAFWMLLLCVLSFANTVVVSRIKTAVETG